MYKPYFLIIIGLGLLASCTQTNKETPVKTTSNESIVKPTNTVKLSSEIDWQKLNPARGDQSPQAGTVWGDRKGTVSTGFLAKFVDGFSSPPHIHNVTYRAVVIKGLVHNDDANAANMWMKPGSFWTQPKGEAHITSAKGEENIAYVEIDYGPYLVQPAKKAYDNGERPINIDASNVVWLGNDKTNWVSKKSNAEVSFLWKGKTPKKLQGLFVKLPQGYNGVINTNGDFLKAIVVKGNLNYTLPQTKETKTLDPGSLFSATDIARHAIQTNEEVVLYIRTNGSVTVN